MEKRPSIKSLLIYNVAAGKLDQIETAQSIVEDVVEGLRAYDECEVTRIHYFPSGMLAYSTILPAIMSNRGLWLFITKSPILRRLCSRLIRRSKIRRREH